MLFSQNSWSRTSSTYGQGLIYLNNRFQNRQTYNDWNGRIMGPIHERGVEQGGVNSSDVSKIFGKVQLSTAQESKLGVPLGINLRVSGIGQADDTGLLSNSFHSLQYLLRCPTLSARNMELISVQRILN